MFWSAQLQDSRDRSGGSAEDRNRWLWGQRGLEGETSLLHADLLWVGGLLNQNRQAFFLKFDFVSPQIIYFLTCTCSISDQNQIIWHHLEVCFGTTILLLYVDNIYSWFTKWPYKWFNSQILVSPAKEWLITPTACQSEGTGFALYESKIIVQICHLYWLYGLEDVA